MSAPESRPWWEKMSQFNTFEEKQEFLRGVGGAQSHSGTSGILYAIIAGYVGGRLAQRKPGQK